MITRLRLIVGIAAIALVNPLALAQSSPGERFELFLATVATDSDRALESLFAGSNIAQAKPLAWSELKAQTKRALSAYGKPLGFEKVSERDFTPSIKRLTYLQKFDAYPVVWHVLFYRAKDAWVANTVVVSDDVGLMLLGL